MENCQLPNILMRKREIRADVDHPKWPLRRSINQSVPKHFGDHTSGDKGLAKAYFVGNQHSTTQTIVSNQLLTYRVHRRSLEIR